MGLSVGGKNPLPILFGHINLDFLINICRVTPMKTFREQMAVVIEERHSSESANSKKRHLDEATTPAAQTLITYIRQSPLGVCLNVTAGLTRARFLLNAITRASLIRASCLWHSPMSGIGTAISSGSITLAVLPVASRIFLLMSRMTGQWKSKGCLTIFNGFP
jgi:hypothetical protein